MNNVKKASSSSKLISSFILSMILHTTFVAVLVFNFSNTQKPKTVTVKLAPKEKKEIVQAGLVDEAVVKQAFERQALAERKRQQALKEEEQRTARLKREAEEAKVRAQKEKIAAEKEKARLQAEQKKIDLAKKQAQKAKEQAELAKKKAIEERRKAEIEQEKIAAAKQKAEQERKEALARKERQEKEALEQKRKAELEAEKQRALETAERRRLAQRASWLDKEVDRHMANIKSAIEDNRILSPSIPSDAVCRVELKLLPDGSIMRFKIIASSGYPAYDAMAETAVRKAAPFTMPEDKELNKRVREFVFEFKNDQESSRA